MENETASMQPGKKPANKFTWLFTFIGLIALLSCIMMIWSIIDDKKILKEANAKLLKEQSDNINCLYKRDSLFREVQQLSSYKALTSAIAHRDKATALLKYKIGDIVRLKADSAKAVIYDIIIGGSKYEYYIKYKVQLKNKTSEEVSPDLVY